MWEYKDAMQTRYGHLDISERNEEAYAAILTDDALEFVAGLGARFVDSVDSLLDARRARQQEIDGGVLPEFLAAAR